MYKILGSDGVEYDSIPIEKIRQWIQEGRVEKETPIMPEDGEDWVFLGTLPEFKEAFAASAQVEAQVEAQAPAKSRRGRLAIYLGVAVLLAAISAFFVYKKFKPH